MITVLDKKNTNSGNISELLNKFYIQLYDNAILESSGITSRQKNKNDNNNNNNNQWYSTYESESG